jgi:hypothetical protein
VLLFSLGVLHYALPVSKMAGLADCGPTRRIPGAPPAVLGLAEWRGNVLTALDLARLLGHAGAEGPPCLVRLAPPLHRAAFYLQARLQMAEIVGESRADDLDGDPTTPDVFDGCFDHDGRLVRAIDPLLVIRSVEDRLREPA